MKFLCHDRDKSWHQKSRSCNDPENGEKILFSEKGWPRVGLAVSVDRTRDLQIFSLTLSQLSYPRRRESRPFKYILNAYNLRIDLMVKRATAVHGFFGIFIPVILNIS